MSLYRFLRFTAVMTVLRRYRKRLARLLFAVAFALVTAWLYGDVATFLEAQHPEWSGPALAIKTGLIYLVLFYAIWEIQRILRGDAGQPPPPEPSRQPSDSSPAEPPRPLDQLIDKPRLKSRRDAILDAPPENRSRSS